MTAEIERRFLVVSDAWRVAASPGRLLRQGYLAQTDVSTIRVRREEFSASLTVKSARCGIVREEITAPLSLADADFMLEQLCAGVLLTKVRHDVAYSGLIWQIDVYGGAAEGVVIAEVELDRPDQPIPLPPWVGKEVTRNRRYRNSAIARRCARKQASAAGSVSLPGPRLAGDSQRLTAG